MKMNKTLLPWMLLALALVTIGCSKPMVTVSGKVSFKGETVPTGQVIFSSEEHGNFGADIDNQGGYRIEVPSGEYGVGIVAQESLPADYQEGDPAPPLKEYVPRHFANPRKSGLSLSLGSERELNQEFQLE